MKAKDPKIAGPADASGWRAAAGEAAPWCSGALFVAITGALIAQGHDGLALTLGVVGAAFLWAAVLVPQISSRGANSVQDVLAQRLSRSVGALSAGIVLAALVGLLAAELTVAARAFSRVSPVAHPAALIIPILLAWVLTLQPWGSRFAAVLTGLTVVALFAAIVSLSLNDGLSGAFGSLVFVPGIGEIEALEQGLREKRLVDPATFKPHVVPFLRTDVLNFAALIASLSLGLALLAQFPAGGPTPAADRVPGQRAARAAVLVIAAVMLLPPLAAAAKRALLALFLGGVRPAALPDWMSLYRRSGALEICGTPAGDAAALAKACGKGAWPQGFLRWTDAQFAQDTLLFAGLDTTLAGSAIVTLFLATTILATVWTARRITLLSEATVRADHGRFSGVILLTVMLVGAAIALLQPADGATLMTWSASLAAAALTPPLVGALTLGRPSPSAAIAAMLTGAIVTLVLILGSRYVPLELFAWTGFVSHAPPAVAKKLAALHDTWLAAADGPGRDALAAQAAKLARDNLNWFGVKPLGAGVIGLAAGGIVMLVGSILASAGARADR